MPMKFQVKESDSHSARDLRLLRSIAYYEWKVAQLGRPVSEREQAELQVYKSLAQTRRAMLSVVSPAT